MAKILPFKAFRPTADKVQLVVSKAVESYDKSEMNFHLRRNPYSFLNVIKANYQRPIKLKGKALFEQIKSNFDQFVHNGIMVQDHQPGYYIYRQNKGNYHYTGIIALASAEDYHSDVIKKHEETLTKREEILKNYLVACPINAEPICFTYPDHQAINELVNKYIHTSPTYFFTDYDQVSHELWIIQSDQDVEAISNAFEEIPAVYIADGHHRSAASALYASEMKANNPNHTGQEDYNAYMGIFFPESELKIFEFNRIVKDLNGLTKDELLDALGQQFEVSATLETHPESANEMTMYLDEEWYSLKCKEGTFEQNDPVKSLDSYILSANILDPIFGIKDLKKDNRVQFVAGIHGTTRLEQMVDKGLGAVAFCLHPVSMEELKNVADSGGNMPPKSTWVEPKLKSALTVYYMNDHQ